MGRLMSRCRPIFLGLILVLLCLPGVSPACLWVEGSTIDGKPTSYSPLYSQQQRRIWHAMDEAPVDKLRHFEEYRVNADSDERVDESVRMILSGKVSDAIVLLQSVEQKSPGKYSTAANLGTAYELIGDNRTALKWISEAIRRNSESHYGTEWLHALILETKLNLESDPNYLRSRRIIPLPEKFVAETKIDVAGNKRSIREVIAALSYQLSERVVFVKPPDPIVADLLFTLGICNAHTEALEVALKPLEKSREYGFQDSDLLATTAVRYQALAKTANAVRWAWRIAIVLAVVVGGPSFLYYCYRRKWFFLSREAYHRHLEAKKAQL